ncbi:MAG: hypothetical protein ASARMPREDX12_008512 [Alectoria sarmentosa]|nr:MAG: hypothetical protein ASARMPRED_007387 [Alectoria sarmentosa]CAD6577795.1 MAG: hypothetical protein ASARMPREDX12_008512 [Alectoria sarmentosa]
MASHVVVLDSSARRAIIRTAPAKHLADVLQEACTKFGLDASRHGLKNNNNKTLDLSQPIRLSGLSSGAKLQIAVLSRSPSAVSVALQLPDSDPGASNRLTRKFPSTTTLWLLLRQFESESTNSEPSRNFTARGIAQVETGASGSGRLFYETPIIQVLGRELASFTDLQKSLAQLGFNNGSVLLRLSFRRTESPVEEAIAEIDKYFKTAEGEQTGGTQSAGATKADFAPSVSGPFPPPDDSERPSPSGASPPSQIQPPPQKSPALLSSQSPQGDEAQARPEFSALLSDALSTSKQMTRGPAERPITVLAPSSASTLAASRQAFNEKDYEPSIAHAKLHQARLATSSVNKRLPTNAELAAQAETQSKRNADVKNLEIKVRFPDQMQVISTFSNMDTSTTIYDFVKGLMEKEKEPFSLNFSSAQGPRSVPRESNVRLMGDLGMAGRVLVNVVWEAGASSEVRGGSVLKSEFQNKAKEIEIKEIAGVEAEEKPDGTVEGKGKQKDEGRERKGGVPRWLKLPGKK